MALLETDPFTEKDCFRHALDYNLRWDNDRHSSVKVGDQYYSKNLGFLTPLHYERWGRSYREISYHYVEMFYWIYKNAEAMRMTLVDESIPLRVSDNIYAYEIYDGGRVMNASALEDLRYWPALPELREAMLHDKDSELRRYCVAAIGAMGKRAYKYRKDICQSILATNDEFYQEEAVKTLGKLNDKESVPLLCDLFHETCHRINHIPFKEMLKVEQSGLLRLIETIIRTVFLFDQEAARELLAIGLSSDHPCIYHWSKRAFELSDWTFLDLIEHCPSVKMGFLPKNPHWSLIHRLG